MSNDTFDIIYLCNNQDVYKRQGYEERNIAFMLTKLKRKLIGIQIRFIRNIYIIIVTVNVTTF